MSFGSRLKGGVRPPPPDGRGPGLTASLLWGSLLLFVVLHAGLPECALAAGCLDCHEKKKIGKGGHSVHQPFAEDDCTACHADHGDAKKLVLARSDNALCEECHDPGDKDLLRAHHNIRGNRASCLACHDPHRSTQEHLLRPDRHRPLAFGRCDQCHRYDGRLLKPTVRELCLGCHAGDQFSRRVSHAPVRAGECLACHDPHASRQPFLLKARYAPGRWITGEADVALCLQCHKRQSLFSTSLEGTRFRDDARNYHTLHVVGSGAPAKPGEANRPLSCRNCHEVHTSEEPRLIRQELDCDGVPCLRLEFRRLDRGGQCRSGCHGPRAYSVGGGGEIMAVAKLQPAAVAADGTKLPEPSPLEKSIDKRCVACHQKSVKKFVKLHIHAPVRSGNCSACHLDHGPENRLILLGKEDRVCSKCHELRSEHLVAAHRGYPLEGSRCSECHDPHAAENTALLYPRRHAPFQDGDCGACHTAPDVGWRIPGGVNNACARCHKEVGRETLLHGAIGKQGCIGCHSPHLSNEAKLLRAPPASLCYRCHPRPVFAQGSVHPPAGEGDCAACHRPHGAAIPDLLARPYPLEQFVTFAPERYELCWECHDEGALTDPARAAETGFSDGKRNLHALHLRDHATVTELGRRVQPGISCRNCHDPHATEGPRLIRSSLDCNGVPCLKVEFHKVGDGGKCLGGCHVTQSYVGAR